MTNDEIRKNDEARSPKRVDGRASAFLIRIFVPTGRQRMICLNTIILAGRSWTIPCLIAMAALAGALIWASRRNAAERWGSIFCGALKLAGLAALASCLLE